MDHNGVLYLCLRRCLPHGLGEVVQDVVELSLKNSVEPLITAHGLELAAVDSLTIHHDLLLQLLANTFEPLALRLGPWSACKNCLHRCLDALTVCQQWLPQRGVSNVTHDRCRDVLIGRLS